MAETATIEFLTRLKNTYPSSGSPSPFAQSSSNADFANPWFIVAAIAYGASNRPEAVPIIYKFILNDLDSEGADIETKRRVTTALRDAIYKAGIISGYSRVSFTGAIRPSCLSC